MNRTSIGITVVVASTLVAAAAWRLVEQGAARPDASVAGPAPGAGSAASSLTDRIDTQPPLPGSARASGMLAVTLRPASAVADATTPTIAVTRATVQVQLRLHGDLPPVDELSAEVTPRNAPDRVRRLPIDATPPGADGATAAVTLPGYALDPGDYTVTVWRGDAETVQRYAFRVTG